MIFSYRFNKHAIPISIFCASRSIVMHIRASLFPISSEQRINLTRFKKILRVANFRNPCETRSKKEETRWRKRERERERGALKFQVRPEKSSPEYIRRPCAESIIQQGPDFGVVVSIRGMGMSMRREVEQGSEERRPRVRTKGARLRVDWSVAVLWVLQLHSPLTTHLSLSSLSPLSSFVHEISLAVYIFCSGSQELYRPLIRPSASLRAGRPRQWQRFPFPCWTPLSEIPTSILLTTRD